VGSSRHLTGFEVNLPGEGTLEVRFKKRARHCNSSGYPRKPPQQVLDFRLIKVVHSVTKLLEDEWRHGATNIIFHVVKVGTTDKEDLVRNSVQVRLIVYVLCN